MKSDKGKSLILLGIGLLLLAGVCLYISLSQPKISEGVLVENTTITATADRQNNYVVSQYSGSASETDTASNVKSNTTQQEQSSIAYPVNLNTASAEELMSVEGIGEQRAAAILSYRDYLGGYTSVEQLKNISGFGDALFEKVAPYFTV